MNNRTLLYLTTLVLIGMTTLLIFNLSLILTGKHSDEPYLHYNHVRGMAVEHRQLLYTLNFDQQNAVIHLLNHAAPISEIEGNNSEKPAVDKIVVYLFDQPDLTITPVADVDRNLIFSVPEWVPNGYLMEMSDGNFQHLLSQTYDH